MAVAIYLRFTHAISYRRLNQLFLHLYGLRISEGALDAMLQRAKPCFDNEVAAILARLRRSRIVCSDETTVRIDGRTHWNWVFQNDQVVIHIVRNTRAASVVTETMAGHRPSIWVSDLYGAQQGHADLWQVCLAHQLRDCKATPNNERVDWDRDEVRAGGADSGVSGCRLSSPHGRCISDSRTVCGG
jgi:transposase